MAFNPNDHFMKLKGKDYLPVAARIVWFRDQYPDGIIKTEHIELTDQRAVFKATITKFDGESDIGSATGYGSETPKDFGDYIEKAETKAVGRALAALGFGTLHAPELDEGERIVDSPFERPQTARNAPKPRNPNVDPSTFSDRELGAMARDNGPQHSPAMRRIHAVGNKHGFTHEELRILCDREERAANNRRIASMNDAPEALLMYVSDLIEKDAATQRAWLDQLAELNPGPDVIPNPN